ncbi:MAG TPA: hypothetical protein VMS76_02900 [Planctomycetota bacterium]|nr:hypothetical protein [Planctomycetota bacterium]
MPDPDENPDIAWSLFGALRDNAQALADGEIEFEEFATTNHEIWAEVEAAGPTTRETVLAALREGLGVQP